MALPKQVTAREDRANELLKSMGPGEAAPAPAPTSANDPSPEPRAPEPTREDWKARYLVLQGKYDAEVPRLNTEVKQLREENDRLKAEAAKRESVPANTGPKPDPTGITEEDLERFDPELVELVKRAAQGAAQQQIEPISKVVQETQAEREKRIEAERQHKQQADFMEAFTDLVPDYEQIDKAPAFHAYLREVDPATGEPRQTALNEAARVFDVVKAARIFNTFKRAKAGGQQQTRSPNPALEEQLTPDRAGGARTVQQDDQRMWTRQEIKQFYSDVAAGRIRDPQKIAQTEQDIDRAAREGRVR